ncbi:hypothetical protein PGTUg99_013180 [Puccinia graminis f. sp. tritici]|uniref:Monopolin complex subunit Csm1/Pcs1 C-terminal domain-containing protein n=1 Tax=Puccinia graminis f. sp. tritici TaxID=56615 RepID=A0A5B0M412_PUCGR|nr:hypothetical protein PGTUg99_013180 [Puccinia graminis f. sp. tritici]
MPPKKKTKNNSNITKNNNNNPTEDQEEQQLNHEKASTEQQPQTAISRTKTTDLTQKVARLLSQEPASSHPLTTNKTSNNGFILSNTLNPTIPLLNHADLNHQLNSLIDQKLEIFNEKIKLYQNQISQLRRELETKDQLLDELQKIRQTDAEQLLEKHKQIAESKYAGYEKLTKAQDETIKSLRQKVIDVNGKLSRVYSGEEERDRQRLEEEKEALVQTNQQLKAAHDAQRKRRKEAERAAQQASLLAEENVQEQLKEANDEVKTLKKMLNAETENSKALIVQLNQLRNNNNNNNHSTSAHPSQQRTNHPNHSASNNHHQQLLNNEKTIEDLKRRLSIMGDFTGLEILSSQPDHKGPIFECIVADILNRGFALHFKLQVHPDETCSFSPSLDPERDSATIKVVPDFLRQFIRFESKARSHIYWKLFQAFNLQDT